MCYCLCCIGAIYSTCGMAHLHCPISCTVQRCMSLKKQDYVKLSKALVTTLQWCEKGSVKFKKINAHLRKNLTSTFFWLWKTAISIYCVSMFFSSGPVLYHITAAHGVPPIPFSLWDTVLSLQRVSDFRSQWFCFKPPLFCIFPLSVFTIFHGS